ncbi:MAG: LpqB family beta-propeller domain-containing protein [Acidobacteriota bacterium]
MNADGSAQTRLTANPAGDFGPAWSPDGTKIAFYSDRDGNAEIYVMNADGSGQTRLTTNSVPDVSPSWSPDGSMIAFVRGAGPSEIYVMNTDGSGQTRLTPTDGLLVDGPNWAPDGTKIAYGGGFGFGRRADIYVINADGSGRTNLTNNPAADEGLPAWSPDGTKIVLLSDRDQPGNGDIYVMNANGSGVIRLTTTPAADSTPDWQPTSVVPPNNPPVAVCQDVQVSADESCEATIAPSDVDGGSYDPDGDDITLSLDNTGPFSLGEHTVTLTVTDEHAESDSCQATVTVVDNTVPTPTLTDPVCVTVGKGKKSANKLTAGATDNCTESSTITIDDVQVFNNGGNPVHGNGVYDVVGNDIYVYPNGKGWTVRVTITATDGAGNGTTSTITKPLLKCK